MHDADRRCLMNQRVTGRRCCRAAAAPAVVPEEKEAAAEEVAPAPAEALARSKRRASAAVAAAAEALAPAVPANKCARKSTAAPAQQASGVSIGHGALQGAPGCFTTPHLNVSPIATLRHARPSEKTSDITTRPEHASL